MHCPKLQPSRVGHMAERDGTTPNHDRSLSNLFIVKPVCVYSVVLRLGVDLRLDTRHITIDRGTARHSGMPGRRTDPG